MEWLYDPSERNRRSGRTLAQIIALIRVAARAPGNSVCATDHYSNYDSAANFRHHLENMVDSDPRLRSYYERTTAARYEVSFRFNASMLPIADWWPPESVLENLIPLPPAIQEEALLEHLNGIENELNQIRQRVPTARSTGAGVPSGRIESISGVAGGVGDRAYRAGSGGRASAGGGSDTTIAAAIGGSAGTASGGGGFDGGVAVGFGGGFSGGGVSNARSGAGGASSVRSRTQQLSLTAAQLEEAAQIEVNEEVLHFRRQLHAAIDNVVVDEPEVQRTRRRARQPKTDERLTLLQHLLSD